MSFDTAQRIADAVLWEGYVLYPYRASAMKNRFRWAFGVLVPQRYGDRTGEPWSMTTECLIESQCETLTVDLRVRFLQFQVRRVEQASADGQMFRPVQRVDVDGEALVSWDEAVEHRLDKFGIPVPDLLGAEQVFPFEIGGGTRQVLSSDRAGAVRARVVRESWPLSCAARVSAVQLERGIRLRVTVENRSPCPAEPLLARPEALRYALNGTHTLLEVHGGSFLSLTDPPEWAQQGAAACSNRHTWPVLVGEPGSGAVVLSSPIILYDYPVIAPESPGELYDSTEIDEILTLRIMTLTEDEKREARGTDERARRVIERSDALPAEVLERLHGAIRHLAVPEADSTVRHREQ